MAKQIKAIECPKCGSTDKTELKPDYYKCTNCDTEYYLDNDDITINHNVNYRKPPQSKPPLVLNKKTAMIIGIGSALFVLAFVVLPSLFSSTKKDPTFTSSDSGDSGWWSNTQGFYISGRGHPIMVIAGDKHFSGVNRESKNGAYVGFYDLLSKKLIKLDQIKVPPQQYGNEFQMRHFSNGDVYLIANKQKIFKVNQSDFSVDDVTSSLFNQHPEMTSGVANAEFIYPSDGEGLKLISNEGKNYFYFLLVDKLYSKDEKRKKVDELKAKEPGEKLQTAYKFSRESSKYPDEGIQLIQYIKKENAGEPDDEPMFEWRHDHFDKGDPKKIVFFGKDLVRSWKDFTPNRKYFNPKMLYFDKDVVLFVIANTPTENAPKSLQCLDAKTATTKFTLPLEGRYQAKVLRYKDGFVIDNNTGILVVDNTGKLISEFKIQ